MREYLDDLRENWTDSYWRADHPEFTFGVAVIAGVVAGLFRVALIGLELVLRRRLA